MSVYIIAEAGVNHNGDIKLAKKMIEVAKDSGADCIKFQTFKSEKIVSKNSRKADYQLSNTDKTESQFDMLKKLELSETDYIELKNYCDFLNIDFMSTPFDLDSVDLLSSLGMKKWKIPSGEITNYPLLKKIGGLKKEVILSTGMSTIDEIEDAIAVLQDTNHNPITILHCTTEYPAPYKDVNLLAINLLKEKFQYPIGYSDHTKGIEVPIAAVALGAKVIEKHFTLDKTMKGPDHQASLNPEELGQMVSSIRNIEKAMGLSQKLVTPSELKNREIVRKSIVASKIISKGDLFTIDNITTKRPGYGINPMRWNDIIGKKSTRDYKEDEMIEK